MALIAVTSLAVARVNAWFVPPYLILMAWILLGPRGGPRTRATGDAGADSGAGLQTADRLIPPPAPSPEPEPPAPAEPPARRSRFGMRRRVDPAQADPVPEPSAAAPEPDPREPQPSAVRGWFARRKQAATLDDPEPTEPPASSEPTPEASAEPAPPTPAPKTRRRRRKKAEPPPEPPTEVAWVRVGPNQFVRQETPLSTDPNADPDGSPEGPQTLDGSVAMEPRVLETPNLDPQPQPEPEPIPAAPEAPPLPLGPDPVDLSAAPTIEEPPTAPKEPGSDLEPSTSDPEPGPDPQPLPEPESSGFGPATLDEPDLPEPERYDPPGTSDDSETEHEAQYDTSEHFYQKIEGPSSRDEDDLDADPKGELSGQQIDDFPDDLDVTPPEEDDNDDPEDDEENEDDGPEDDDPPPDDDPEDDDPPPDDDPNDPIRHHWDPDDFDDEGDQDDSADPSEDEDPAALGPDTEDDEAHWSEHHPGQDSAQSEEEDDDDEDEDWNDDEDEDDDRWGASAAELAESIVGDAYHSPEPPPPEPTPPAPPPPQQPEAAIGPDQGGIVGYGQDLQSYLNDLITMSGGVGVVPAPASPPPMAPYRPAPPPAPEPSGPELPTPREPEAASADGDRTGSSDEDDDAAAGSASPPDRVEPAEPIGPATRTASAPDHPDTPDEPLSSEDRHLAPSNPDEAIGRPLLRPGTRLTISKSPEQKTAAGRATISTTHPESCESSTSSHRDRRCRPRDPHLPRAPPGGGFAAPPLDRIEGRAHPIDLMDARKRSARPRPDADRNRTSWVNLRRLCSTPRDLGRDPSLASVEHSGAFGTGRPRGDLANLPDEAARSGLSCRATAGAGSALLGRLESISELVHSADDRPPVALATERTHRDHPTDRSARDAPAPARARRPVAARPDPGG